MKTFLEHVEPLRAADFPTLAQFDTRGNLPKYIERINAALSSGAIANPDYIGVKDALGSIMEKAQNTPESIMNAAVRHEDSPGHRGFTLHDFYGSVYPHQIAGKLAKAEKSKPVSNEDRIFMAWYLPMMRELAPMGAAIVALKDLAVKRVVKTEADKAAEKQRYIAPMAKSESGQAIRLALTKLTDAIKGDYATAVVEYFLQKANAWVKLTPKEQYDQRRWYQDVLGVHRAWVTGDYAKGFGFPIQTLAPTHKTSFTDEAKKLANDMQEAFVYKNSLKLVSILERKGLGLSKEPKVLKARADQGVFEGEIQIEFVDDSRFVVRNKIVMKQNSYGTVFNQFPTTFHDVVLPNGSQMGQPSEERMNEIFAKGN